MPFDRLATAMQLLTPWVSWIPGYHTAERLVVEKPLVDDEGKTLNFFTHRTRKNWTRR